MRNVTCTAIAGVLLAAALAGSAWARNPVLRQLEDSFVRLHEDVRPVVVNIDTRGSAPERQRGGPGSEDLDEFFRFFGIPFEGMPQRRQPQTRSTGSGFIYDKQGHIITNNHVVENADRIIVKLWNGNEYEAQVIGADPDTDLAVIKIDAQEDLPVARLGDSDSIRVGQFAIALGSPRGFEGSLSFGHISALGRENLAGLAAQGLRFQNLIQTDAAINLGNSGGPLCNIDGEVIGINIAIVWGANSLGFAIPVNTAKNVIPQLISEGRVSRGYLGVGIVDADEYAESLGMEDSLGAFVKQVQEDTPAARADLQVYDVIRKVNGQQVLDASDLVRKISDITPGQRAVLEIWRDEKAIEVEVRLDEWQPQAAAAAPARTVMGIEVRALTPEMAERLGVGEADGGVLVTNVEAGSAAEEAGLMQGDVILEVARRSVSSPQEFRDIMNEAAKPGESVLIRFVRQGRTPDITVLRIPAGTR